MPGVRHGGRAATATWTAADSLSGMAGPTQGSFVLKTSSAGTFTASKTVLDRVHRKTVLTCTSRVDQPG